MSKMRLLYIEGSDSQRRVLKQSLLDRDIEVCDRPSGDKGIEALEHERVDAVLCDLNMPGTNGMEVLQHVKSTHPDLPLIFVTAHPSLALAIEAIRNGAYRFLTKPVNVDELELTLHQAVEHALLQRWLRQADEQLRLLVETTPVPFIISRLEDGRILYANRHLATLVGSTPAEMKNRRTTDFYYDPAERQRVVERLEKDGHLHDFELRIKGTQGRPVWTVLSLATMELAGERVISGGLLDITRRKEAEEKLRLYRRIYRSSIDVVTIHDAQGRIIERNPAHEKKSGYRDDEVLGRTPAQFLGEKKFREILRSVEDTGSYRGEVLGQTKDGTTVWMDVSVFPILDEQGRPFRYVSVGRDVTEIKLALADLAYANQELRDTQAHLVQSEKMASLGSLVAGIAHEINTPIGAIGSMHDTLVRAVHRLHQYLENRLTDKLAMDPKIQSAFELIAKANEVIKTGYTRVTEIVRRLRSFARLDEAELKKVDVHEGLEDTLSLLHHEIKHHITVSKDYGAVPPIWVYPGRLNQVFLNILKQRPTGY